MLHLILGTAIRLVLIATFVGPPARTTDEVIDDRMEQYLRGGWTLCGDADATALVNRVLKRMKERDQQAKVNMP